VNDLNIHFEYMKNEEDMHYLLDILVVQVCSWCFRNTWHKESCLIYVNEITLIMW